MTQIAEQLHISLSYCYKRIKGLNKQLNNSCFQIKQTSKKKLKLEGDEWKIRLFIIRFFLDNSLHNTWHFRSIYFSENEIDNIIHFHLMNSLKKLPYSVVTRLKYILGIWISRLQQNQFIKQTNIDLNYSFYKVANLSEDNNSFQYYFQPIIQALKKRIQFPDWEITALYQLIQFFIPELFTNKDIETYTIALSQTQLPLVLFYNELIKKWCFLFSKTTLSLPTYSLFLFIQHMLLYHKNSQHNNFLAFSTKSVLFDQKKLKQSLKIYTDLLLKYLPRHKHKNITSDSLQKNCYDLLLLLAIIPQYAPLNIYIQAYKRCTNAFLIEQKIRFHFTEQQLQITSKIQHADIIISNSTESSIDKNVVHYYLENNNLEDDWNYLLQFLKTKIKQNNTDQLIFK